MLVSYLGVLEKKLDNKELELVLYIGNQTSIQTLLVRDTRKRRDGTGSATILLHH